MSDTQDISVLQGEYAAEDRIYQLKMKVATFLQVYFICSKCLKPSVKLLFLHLVYRTFKKSIPTFERHGQMEIVSTELLASHIWSHYWTTAKSCKGSVLLDLGA